jgi:Organic solvent tolerance protein OstA
VSLYIADSCIYNTETKKIRASTGRTESEPYFLTGSHVTSISDNGYLIENGTFTTDDSPKADFHLHARKIRVYEGDRVILMNVTAYVGKVPIFWWPYLYQSLDNAFSFSISPGYYSTWGPSLLTQVTFPIRDNIQARLRLNYYGRRGRPSALSRLLIMGKTKAVPRR